MTPTPALQAFTPPRWLRVGALVLLAHGLLLWQMQTWDSSQPAAWSSGEPILAQVLIDAPAATRAPVAPAAKQQRAPSPASAAPSAATAATTAATTTPTASNTGSGGATPASSTTGGDTASARPRSNDVVLPSADAAYLQNPPPVYPRMSRRLGEQGTVVLRVLINAQGQPERVELRTSSGFARLDQSALDVVPRWRFVPGQRQGVPEAMWFNVPVRFVLE